MLQKVWMWPQIQKKRRWGTMTSSLVHSIWAFVFCLLFISLCWWADAMQTNKAFLTEALRVRSRCYERQSLELSWPFNKLRTYLCSADKLLVKLSPLEHESVSPLSVMVNHPPTSSKQPTSFQAAPVFVLGTLWNPHSCAWTCELSSAQCSSI